MGSSMLKVVPSRLVTESTVAKQQSAPKLYPLNHQANQICCLWKQKEGCFTLTFS
ncbi:unnamed protein product [Hymenolepis diminuta]|uniref:Uncharacterized protein n=1 Tax=Hymenolepis diminuta TaxID=6216 RepID=A0A564Z2C8_HYMDI|nr:unnamed protein product [Hymenolepis diminuta]